MEIGTLEVGEIDAWIKHCTDIFKHDTDDYFISHLKDDSKALQDMTNILVVRDQGNIVATVRIIPRRQFIQGRIVSVGAIGEVSTKETYQKRGLASILLKKAINGPLCSYEISALHTDADRLGVFYGRHGWESIALRDAIVHLEVNLPLPSDISISKLNIIDHPDEILALYHNMSSKFNGPFLRDVSYLMKWIVSRHKRDNISAYGAWSSSGQLIGYVFGRVNKHYQVVVDELILASSSTSLPLATQLIASVSPLPLTASMPLTLAKAIGFTVVETKTDHGFMYQRHNLSNSLWNSLMTSQDVLFWKTDGF